MFFIGLILFLLWGTKLTQCQKYHFISLPLHHSTAKSINQNKSKQKSPISKRILPHTLPQVYPRCCGCTARTAASHSSWASSGQAQGLAVPLAGSPVASLTAQYHRAPCHQSLPDENLSHLPTQGGEHHTQAPWLLISAGSACGRVLFLPQSLGLSPFPAALLHPLHVAVPLRQVQSYHTLRHRLPFRSAGAVIKTEHIIFLVGCPPSAQTAIKIVIAAGNPTAFKA